jgi:hypothetical protein
LQRVTREKLKALLEVYGRVAIAVYFGIFVLTLAGFALAISFGIELESAKGGAGLLMASWLATKLTQPLRIAGTVALTPIVAGAMKRRRARSSVSPSKSDQSQSKDVSR